MSAIYSLQLLLRCVVRFKDDDEYANDEYEDNKNDDECDDG